MQFQSKVDNCWLLLTWRLEILQLVHLLLNHADAGSDKIKMRDEQGGTSVYICDEQKPAKANCYQNWCS